VGQRTPARPGRARRHGAPGDVRMDPQDAVAIAQTLVRLRRAPHARWRVARNTDHDLMWYKYHQSEDGGRRRAVWFSARGVAETAEAPDDGRQQLSGLQYGSAAIVGTAGAVVRRSSRAPGRMSAPWRASA
jgi:hypothetical protein